jgi:hypothetical protein
MRLAVDGLSRFLARSLGEAEDLARHLVKPVSVIPDPVLVLDLHVLSVGVRHRLGGKPFQAPVVIHE